MSGRLIAHSGTEYIDREGLKALETPPATDTWTPIPHYDLVVALDGQLKARGNQHCQRAIRRTESEALWCHRYGFSGH
jgi:hypothetical protein